MDGRASYRASLIEELETYSFKPRKRGSPKNSGCVRELDGIKNVDIEDPIQLAKLVKEQLHLNYQKDTTRRLYDAFIANL